MGPRGFLGGWAFFFGKGTPVLSDCDSAAQGNIRIPPNFGNRDKVYLGMGRKLIWEWGERLFGNGEKVY